MTLRVPVSDPRREAAALEDELVDAARRVIASGTYILGPEVAEFERELAEWLGVANVVGVASGTDALVLALRACGVTSGDLVVVPAFTFFATASAVLALGAVPVVVDVDDEDLNLSAERLEAVLEGTSEPHRRVGVDPDSITAVIPVHLYGKPAPIDRIRATARDRGLRVVEDAAQALGAVGPDGKVGAHAAPACFSFFPTKNLGAFGDGGAVATDDDGLADDIRLRRAHGASEKYHHIVAGTNSRLDAMQAALLRVKLASLQEHLDARRSIAGRYRDGLAGVAGLRLPDEPTVGRHAFHQYTVQVEHGRREDFRSFLDARGVGTAVYYPSPVHLQPALGLGHLEGDLPSAERAAREACSLPMFPMLRDEEIDHVIATVGAFFSVFG